MARKNGNGKRTPRGMQAPYITKGAKSKKKTTLADRARKGLKEFGGYSAVAVGLGSPAGGIASIATRKYITPNVKKAIKATKRAKGRGPLR